LNPARRYRPKEKYKETATISFRNKIDAQPHTHLKNEKKRVDLQPMGQEGNKRFHRVRSEKKIRGGRMPDGADPQRFCSGETAKVKK